MYLEALKLLVPGWLFYSVCTQERAPQPSRLPFALSQVSPGLGSWLEATGVRRLTPWGAAGAFTIVLFFLKFQGLFSRTSLVKEELLFKGIA